jgi:hypothetical protein
MLELVGSGVVRPLPLLSLRCTAFANVAGPTGMAYIDFALNL